MLSTCDHKSSLGLMVRRSEQPSGVPKEPKQTVHSNIFLGALPSASPSFSPFLTLSAFLPWINSPSPAEPLTSQPQAMGPLPEIWIIISLLLLLSTAGLGVWRVCGCLRYLCSEVRLPREYWKIQHSRLAGSQQQ